MQPGGCGRGDDRLAHLLSSLSSLYSPEGRRQEPSHGETKTFHSRDGLGLRWAMDAGLKIGIISGRGSPVVEYRAKELGIHFLVQDAREKLLPYEKILRAARLRDQQVCYVGDDIVDLPVLKRVGLAVGVGDGHPLLRRYVHYWTRYPGGMGALRETIELILSAQGKLDAIVRRYLG